MPAGIYVRKNLIFSDKNKINKLLKMAKTKEYSAPQLAKIFNCGKTTILRTLKQNNVTLENLGRFKKKFYCNNNFFETLTHSSAYWAGFIAADGCLYKRDRCLSIGLNKRDIKHLQKFGKVIGTQAPIYQVKSNNSVKLCIYSKNIFNSLIELGIKPNKSLNINKVKVPYNLMFHFIRGVFDGDGSISGKKITHIQFMIAGNKPFLQQIQNVFVDECGVNKVKIYPLKSKGYKLQYTGSQIFRILKFIYKDSTEKTRLDRKYKKYLVFKEKFSSQKISVTNMTLKYQEVPAS